MQNSSTICCLPTASRCLRWGRRFEWLDAAPERVRKPKQNRPVASQSSGSAAKRNRKTAWTGTRRATCSGGLGGHQWGNPTPCTVRPTGASGFHNTQISASGSLNGMVKCPGAVKLSDSSSSNIGPFVWRLDGVICRLRNVQSAIRKSPFYSISSPSTASQLLTWSLTPTQCNPESTPFTISLIPFLEFITAQGHGLN
ncbi:hypothetical protein P152DRAFT_173698 [Eremomyces bilateralis CBS 781.70]|uniref:Uncharacterized protein n=1 Tax=Eremomyces bilateralis CBS 781.70 TaxID=1392243 RepID=A0A6G1FTA1_9PEZI|nr:uncharacterized protein P152DRAFT_173698 [Eremomyces bilateralis CBS 781.70]KAF1809017.1 hypothetical protein P152DRAFT_173698 [Eremomyces bilateralis CBS 781.70]